MSANTSISEGGKGYPFGPVKCLMVEGDDGEFCPWYSEADRALDSLSVTQNGIYRASDRGVYGWNRVSANVPQTDRVTGRDPETGDEKTVTVDPETGELVETVVPVEIRIETPPTFTGPYGDGAYIDFTGLTVAAYGANGDKMLDVPFNELIFPVTIAHYDGSQAQEMSDGAGLNAVIGTANGDLIIRKTAQRVNVNGHICLEGGFTAILTYYNGVVYLARYGGQIGVTIDVSGESSAGTWGTAIYSNLFTRVQAMEKLGIPASEVDPEGKDVDTLYPVGGSPIPVQWRCTDSGEILETSFNIIVVDVSPNNNAGN